MTDSYYALRYLPHVPMGQRKHMDVVGRFGSFEAAEGARVGKPNGNLMESVYRDNDLKVVK